MNIPEIAKCPWCEETPQFETLDGPVGEQYMAVRHPDNDCILARQVFSPDDWNRRQPTPEAADLYKRLCQAQRCPNCPDQGWYAVGQGDNVEQCQCQFCYETPDSLFNVVESVKAHPPKPEPTEAAELVLEMKGTAARYRNIGDNMAANEVIKWAHRIEAIMHRVQGEPQ